jgi:iron complex outermembrane receptor protein
LYLLAAMCAALGISVGSAPDALAQAESNASAGSGDNTPEELIVTGTRRTDRSATDSASPIDVVSGEELRTQPAANMLDVLKNVVPSFFVGQNTISDASSIIRAPSLRGLPSDQVLVMINGKRFNRSALVQVYNGGDTGLSFGSHGSDIASIPNIAIKSWKCCAMARRRSTVRMRSQACSIMGCATIRDSTL